MPEKIVLIDGHSILNRAFYGLPMLTNSEGKHTNAVYGFLNIMFKVLEEEQADYVAVAFDLHAPTFRHKMYEAYKGTRKPMPEELREQVPLMKEMLGAMHIPVMSLEGYEADDILGTVSRQMERAGLSVSIVSGDRDLLQLATGKIQIRIPKTKATGTEIEDYYADQVKEKYQVTPTQFIDLKALMGDTSDNIPGVPGIGEKTATKIIVQYGSIEEAYAHVDAIMPARARESLRNHYDLAQMSKTLATIDLQVPYTLDETAARIENLYTPEALELCRRLEFKNLLGRFSSVQEDTKKSEETYEWVSDLSRAEEILAGLAGRRAAFQLIFDEDGRLLGAAVSEKKQEAVFLACEGFLTETYLTTKLAETIHSMEQAVTIDLKPQLMRLPLSMQDAALFDAAIAAYLLNPLKGSYEAEDLARDYLDWMVPSRSELLGKMPLHQTAVEQREDFLRYVCRMAAIAYQALPVLEERLRAEDMMKLFTEVEMLPFTTCVIWRMPGSAWSGRRSHLMAVSCPAGSGSWSSRSAKRPERYLISILRNSLVSFYLRSRSCRTAKDVKTGYSTAADVLEKLAVDYPIVAHILEYRQLTKLKSTYADGLANYIAEDGRIHGKFHQTITATGRLSSTEPNLQNIPIRMELGRLIRKVFVPRQGFVFLDADYSQIELRVLAHLSGDEMLIQAYQDAQDIHTITASQVFHVKPEEVTPLLRRNAKAVNFGIVYGISSFGLSQDLSITRKEAQEYIEQYFKTYPGIKRFLDQSVADAKEKGYVTTMFGRRRPVPELKSSNFMQRSFGERVAMNAPIQGTAADIIKIAMIRVDEALRAAGMKSRLILQVHDELLIETAKEELPRVEKLLCDEMMHAADLRVKLEVDVHSGKDWYEAK